MNRATGQYVVFLMGGEKFVLEVGRVVEVLKHRDVRLIPNMPEFLVGVIDFRGRVIPVMDLRKRFRLAPAGNAKNRIIILRNRREMLGIMVDNVTGIVSLDPSHISVPPAIFNSIGSEYIRGIGKSDGKMLVILNMVKLLIPEEFTMMKEELGAKENPCNQ